MFRGGASFPVEKNFMGAAVEFFFFGYSGVVLALGLDCSLCLALVGIIQDILVQNLTGT